MQLREGVNADYKEGKIIIEVEVAKQLNPLLDKIKADVESGEIDPIKGTDLDKMGLLAAIETVKAYVNK
jgi:hypothetical protein